MAATHAYFSLLPDRLSRNRNFVLLWCAYAVSALGDHLSEMAILKSQDALAANVDITPLTARIDFTVFAGFLIAAPSAGVLADRFARRHMMILADLVRMVIFFLFPMLLAATAGLGSWGSFLPLVPVGMMTGLFSPSRAALLPSIVRPNQLVRANALISGLGIVATMVGIGLGGYLAQHYVPSVAFKLDAYTFLGSALLIVAMRPLPAIPAHGDLARDDGDTVPRKKRRHGGNLLEGLTYIRQHRKVLQLILIAMTVWFCGPLVKSVVPAIVKNSYGGDFEAIGRYLIMIGVGIVVGAVVMAFIGDRVRTYLPMFIGLWGIAGGMILLALSVMLPLPLAARKTMGIIGLFCGGFFAVTTMATFNALLQRIVPDRYRGRIFGVKDVACISALLVATGTLAIPHWPRLDEWVGYILVGVSLITLAAGLVVLLHRFHHSPVSPLLTLTYDLNDFVVRFWWRTEQLGPCTVPREGPVIITANHRCPADPCFFGYGCPYRRIAFIIAAEYCRLPLVNYLVWILGCIPVKRDGSDAGATKHALRHLKAGNVLGIFIEGGIVDPGQTPRPKDGVALLALRSGAKVVPVHISGTVHREGLIAGLLTRHRARVRWGKPVDLSEFRDNARGRDAVRAATMKIYNAIWDLSPDDDRPTLDDTASATTNNTDPTMDDTNTPSGGD